MMPLNDVEMKCFDLSQMSLNPSVTNFKTSVCLKQESSKCWSGIRVLRRTAVPVLCRTRLSASLAKTPPCVAQSILNEL